MIIVTVDASTESESALGVAADLASRFGEPLRVLLVLDGALRHHFHNLAREGDGSFTDAVSAYLADVIDRAAQLGCSDAEGVSRHAVDATEGILEEIAEADPTLLVLATHGRSGVSRWLTGSVAESVIRAAKVPVVVVPATGSEAPAT